MQRKNSYEEMEGRRLKGSVSSELSRLRWGLWSRKEHTHPQVPILGFFRIVYGQLPKRDVPTVGVEFCSKEITIDG